jgi:cytochrome c5
MSDVHEEHVSPIKTPTQLIVTVVAAFVIPITVIVMLVIYVGGAPKIGAGSNSQSPEAIAARIKPISDEGYQFGSGSQAAAGEPAASTAGAPVKVTADTGKKLFEAACSACHGAGIAGAPKFGDKAAWSARIAQGKETLYTHAIKGFQGKGGMMPAKGGSTASDEEVKAAVDYMVAAAK